MASQNSSLEFYLRMYAYFASMGMLTRKMPGFGAVQPIEGNQVPVNSPRIMFWCSISKK